MARGARRARWNRRRRSGGPPGRGPGRPAGLLLFVLLLTLSGVPAPGLRPPPAGTAAPRPLSVAAPRGAPVAARPDVGLGIPPAIALSRGAAPRPRNGTLENLFLNGTESLNLSQTLTLGNLTLEDSARLSFGNPNYSATLTVEGSVFLYGRARLTIWDAFLTFASPYSDAQFLEVAANGSVILKDVDLTSGGHDWSARISQNGNLTVLGTAFGSWCVASFNGSAQGFSS